MYFHQWENSISNDTFNVVAYDNIFFGTHFHKSYEVIYVISGQVSCTINGITGTLSQGEWGFCLPNELHSYRTEAQSQTVICVFSCDYVRSFDKEIKNKRGDRFRFSCHPEVAEFIKKNLFEKPTDNPHLRKACLYAVCGEWRRCVTLSDRDDKRNALFMSILDYIAENYRRNITVSDLAEALGYDYHYISRSFNRHFNMSFADLLNTYRVEHACGQLEGSDDTIVHIAFDSGFQSVRTFNQVFKERTGMTPLAYRNAKPPKKHGDGKI